jgi:ubiquinone/menaquinone biosynthesis C-methylase UbiE
MSWKKKKEVRLRYSAEANGYDELYSDEQRTKYELVLPRVALSEGSRILDCGCGTGIFLEIVAGRVRVAVGVDLSPEMLEKAKRKLGPISTVDLVCADIDFLPFSGSIFRHVFMFTVLPSVRTYWGNAIREGLRVLETHGIMTLSIPKKETSSRNILKKLSRSGLGPGELIDDEGALDYVVVSEKALKTVMKTR